MKGHWDTKAILSRVVDTNKKRRYLAGCPDASEILAYSAGFQHTQKKDTAVIFGMTPELRNLAVSHFDQIISIDESKQAIDFYASWMNEKYRGKERVICANWFDLEQYIKLPVDVIMGDGIFGNLPDVHHHRKLLKVIKRVLHKNGRLLTRKALIPNQFDAAYHNFRNLLLRFRAGKIDDAEFGFGVRLVGHHASCYCPDTYILDNAKLFAACREAHEQGMITAHELSLINRYYFGGNNCILSQNAWEKILNEEGFGFRVHRCQGKAWYAYYILYECFHLKE